MKNAVLFVLVTVLGSLFVPSANAQRFGRDPIIDGQRDAYRIVRSARHRTDRANYGVVGYGYRDGYGRPIGGGRVARDIGAGLLGVAIGGAVGGRKGAIIGGVAGVGAAELGGALMARRGGPIAGPGDGRHSTTDLELVNSTSFPVELYFVERDGKEKSKGRMSAGAAWPLDGRRLKMPKADTGEGYVGYAVIPNRQGGLTSDRLVPTPVENGWEFREPDFGRGGRQ